MSTKLISLFLLVFLISNVSALKIGNTEGSGVKIIQPEEKFLFNGSANATQIPHNELNGLQGGQANEYYHFNLAEWTARIFLFNQSNLDSVYAKLTNQWLFNQSDLIYNFNQSNILYNFNQSNLDSVYAKLGNYITNDSNANLSNLNVTGTFQVKNSIWANSSSVGIGTTNPKRNLEVAGYGTNEGIRLVDATDSFNVRSTTAITDGSGGFMTLTDESENIKALIRSYASSGVQGYFTAGNIGIGTTTPTTPLQVETASAGNQDILSLVVPNAVGNNGSLDFSVNAAGTVAPVGRIESQYASSNNVGLGFYTYNGALSEKMRIKSTGQVGIGTITPTELLELENSLGTNLSLSTPINSIVAGTELGEIIFKGRDDLPVGQRLAGARIAGYASGGWSATTFNGTTGTDIRFYTEDETTVAREVYGNPRLTIYANGTIGIGTTTPSGHLLTINNSARALNVSGNLYVNSTNVGIGTSVPKGLLEIFESANEASMTGLNISIKNTNSGVSKVNGIFSRVVRNDPLASGDMASGYFESASGANIIVGNNNSALYAKATGSGYNYGIYASASGGTGNYAGYFGDGNVKIENYLTIDKDVTITGNLTADNATFSRDMSAKNTTINGFFSLPGYTGNVLVNGTGGGSITFPKLPSVKYVVILTPSPAVPATYPGSSCVVYNGTRTTTGAKFNCWAGSFTGPTTYQGEVDWTVIYKGG